VEPIRTYTAFAGDHLIASGDLRATVSAVKMALDAGESKPILVFDDQTGVQVDFDLRGTLEESIERLASHPWLRRLEQASEEASPAHAGPGRPRLGVVCREVSLLPRHWAWLGRQKGGASAALRRLVDEARKHGQGEERARIAWEAAGKFMWVMAGNLPGFEEASRALHRRESGRLSDLMREWPADIRAHTERLVADAARLQDAAD
jgi:hypothetical protein